MLDDDIIEKNPGATPISPRLVFDVDEQLFVA